MKVDLVRYRFSFKSEASWILVILTGPLGLGLVLGIILWLIEKVFGF